MTTQNAPATVLAWLETAIKEREEAALGTLDITDRVAMKRGKTAPRWSFGAEGSIRDEHDVLRVRFTWPDEAQHITLNDPESVLRRCAADRKLIELHQRADDGTGVAREYPVCRTCTFDASPDPEPLPESWPCPTLLAVAEGYDWTEAQ